MRVAVRDGETWVSVRPLTLDYFRYGRHASGIRWGDRATFVFDAQGGLLQTAWNGKTGVPSRVKPHALHELEKEARRAITRFETRRAQP